jgi:hypothetical protein
MLALMRQQAATAPLNANDLMGLISFADSSGNEFATILCAADATTAAGDYPGRLTFSTCPDGASSPTEQLRITSDRYVRLASGTGGIQFGGDTAAANALDDYEEGTWTPAYAASTTNPTMQYNQTLGRYTKVGRLVTCHFHLRTSNSSTGGGVGNLLISGLPFTSTSIDTNGGRQSGAIASSANFGANNFPNGVTVENNSTTALLTIVSSSANTTNVNAATLTLGNQANSLFGCFSYITA